ncbi:hypothetical protein DFH11DRAFT_1547372 [Phellopilus nigrolimitatus]|nr:hypothetical protein DFH11DRAFT_1547372 [Phellopilus nigrolimitatus]
MNVSAAAGLGSSQISPSAKVIENVGVILVKEAQTANYDAYCKQKATKNGEELGHIVSDTETRWFSQIHGSVSVASDNAYIDESEYSYHGNTPGCTSQLGDVVSGKSTEADLLTGPTSTSFLRHEPSDRAAYGEPQPQIAWPGGWSGVSVFKPARFAIRPVEHPTITASTSAFLSNAGFLCRWNTWLFRRAGGRQDVPVSQELEDSQGKSEPVWPPLLERALVQALLQFNPNDKRYGRALGRFPKRNRFISDIIFKRTGVRRSPKQVGSRLQQLKEADYGKQQRTFTPIIPLANVGPSFSISDDKISSEPPFPLCPSDSRYTTSPIAIQNRRLDIYIIFEPNAAPTTGTAFRSLKYFTGCLARPETVFAIDKPEAPIVLAETEPSAIFASCDPMSGSSVTTVWIQPSADRGDALQLSSEVGAGDVGMTMVKVHQHIKPLVCIYHPPAGALSVTQPLHHLDATGEVAQTGSFPNAQAPLNSFTYKAQLVDNTVWNMLFCEPDVCISRYIIMQELTCNFDNSAALCGKTVLSFTYHFISSSQPLSAGGAGNLSDVHKPTYLTSFSNNPFLMDEIHTSPVSPQPQAENCLDVASQTVNEHNIPYNIYNAGEPQPLFQTPNISPSWDGDTADMENPYSVLFPNSLFGVSLGSDVGPSLGGCPAAPEYVATNADLSSTPYAVGFDGGPSLDFDLNSRLLYASQSTNARRRRALALERPTEYLAGRHIQSVSGQVYFESVLVYAKTYNRGSRMIGLI